MSFPSAPVSPPFPYGNYQARLKSAAGQTLLGMMLSGAVLALGQPKTAQDREVHMLTIEIDGLNRENVTDCQFLGKSAFQMERLFPLDISLISCSSVSQLLQLAIAAVKRHNQNRRSKSKRGCCPLGRPYAL
jgi:uncharacterized protein YsxB (DUF464 family)